MIKIYRILSGFHLALFGCMLLAFFISKATGKGLELILLGSLLSGLSVFFLAPFFVLDEKGLHFTLKIFFLFTYHYGFIERNRIRGIRASWSKETRVHSHGKVAVAARTSYYAIFLEFYRGDPPRKTEFCLKRGNDSPETRNLARRYAQALKCPVVLK